VLYSGFFATLPSDVPAAAWPTAVREYDSNAEGVDRFT
jgi:hypothetical protein